MKKKIILIAGWLLPALVMAQTQANWVHKGPFSASGSSFKTGRGDCIALHPDYDNNTNKTIYLGSHAGGLWKTTDGGDNWTNVNSVGQRLYEGVSAIAIAPGANGTVYVADISFTSNQLFIGSSGIYKYAPATGLWQACGSLPGVTQPLKICHIKIHPFNSQIVFAATTQGLFRTTDGGGSWTLEQSGDFENVAFMRRSCSGGSYTTYVYASGLNTLMYSTDDGDNFTTLSCLSTMMSGHTNYRLDIDVTVSTVTAGDQYLYIYAFINSPNNYCGLFRMTYNSTTCAETCSALGVYSDPNAYTDDRMFITANDKVAYFGGWYPRKYNAFSSTFYYPCATTDCTNQNAPVHMDLHDGILNPATSQFFLVTDGGLYVNTYTPANSPDNGIYNNSWQSKNTGLNISQIMGMSVSETTPDTFATAEIDNGPGGFFSRASTSSTYSTFGSNEHPGILIDKFNDETYFYRQTSYSGSISFSYSGQPVASQSQARPQTSPFTDFCTASNYAPFEDLHLFTRNTFFQDPNRPDIFYYGDGGWLHRFCTSAELFEAFLRPGIVFPSLFWATTPVSMAFSKADKDKLYFTSTGSTSQLAAVIEFIGNDIDDTWVGHNENTSNWKLITPNFLTASFVTTPLSTGDEYKIAYPGIATSDWDPSKAWLAVEQVPNNPQIKVLAYDGTNWTDYSTGILQDEIPTALVYEQGSNDQLYLGTNRGIYYRNASMSQWVAYNTNLPHAAVAQLQGVYSQNSLWAGEFGRGAWQTGFACPSQATITETGTLSADKFDEATQWVKGQNLTISNGDVKFRAGDYVELLPDFLVTANSTTEFFAFIHGCNGPGNTFRAPEQSTLQNAEEVLQDPDILFPGDLLSVIPNPNDGHFALRKNSDELMNIEIYDLMGKLVYRNERVSEKTTQVDLSQSPKGLYLVKASFGNTIKTIRVINQ
ncbi:MAG: glycoside hydrolase precursor [Bacteroidetes bacterium]|nr:MAG: glycoside hydrolase precursor [Bacteroidota bacterium]